MTTLTDEQLDLALRELLDARAEEMARSALPAEVVAGRLAERVAARPLIVQRSLRLAWLVALLAALLVALLGALALIGSQRPILEGSLLRGCESYLGEGVLAEVETGIDMTTLSSDGWIVTDPRGVSLDQKLQRGQLTAQGIRRYLAAIEDAGLAGSCRTLYADVPGEGGVRAVVDGGEVNVRWENRGWVDALRVLTPDETAETVALLHRLEHPEQWIPASEWSVATEVFQPDRYYVGVQFPAPRDPATLILADGSSLADFGVVMRPDMVSGSATLDREHALALRGLLPADRGGNPPDEDMWDLPPFRPDGSSQATIWIEAILPGAAAGAQVLIPPSEPPVRTPDPTPSPTPAPDQIGIDPCGLISIAEVEAILSEDYGHGMAEPVDEPSPGGWTKCRFQKVLTASYWRSFEVFIRRESTTGETARALVQYMFGEARAEDVPGGGRLWVNDCLGRCQNAIAIWTEPYFAIVMATQDTEYSEAQRRALATIVLDSLRTIAREGSQ